MDLSQQDLSKHNKELSKLIKANQSIKSLILNKCNLNIRIEIAESLLSNYSINFLSLDENKIQEKIVPQLKNTHLKKISLLNTNLSSELVKQIKLSLEKPKANKIPEKKIESKIQSTKQQKVRKK